jgi:inosine/xanthosine triphosphatase
MLIALGSRRGPKHEALRATLAEIDPQRTWNIEAIEVDSGVRETPLGRDETRLGACLRVEHLLEKLRDRDPRPDLFVGMEGGIAVAGEQAWLENWAYASDGQQGYFGGGGSVPLPQAIIDEVVKKGRSLSAVIDEIAGRNDIRSQEGTWGILTANRITRQQAFRSALIGALAPFLLSQTIFRP